MNKKRFCALTLIIIIGLSTSFLCLIRASGTTETSVSLSPAIISGATMSIGSTFTVDIEINNVTNLGGWTVSISWNPSILQMQGTPTEGPFLKTAGNTLFVPVPPNNTLGILPSLSDVLLTSTGASGSGELSVMTFSVAGQGTCQISINNTGYDTEFDTAMDANGNTSPIPVTISEATYTSSAILSTHGPIASFSPADGSNFLIDTSVPLNASSSQPGYDSQNSQTCNINSYVWSIEYLNGTTFTSLTGETPTFEATALGAFRIILIVTANDTQPNPDPSYVSTGSTSAIINVITKAQSVNVDVFTDQGGIGPGVSSGLYGPLQLVQMYASVTSNSTSMPDENVTFYIQNSNDSLIAVRQGITNQTGIASANFRLPSPDPTAPQNNFGIWSITASVNVTGVMLSDITNFTFNYQSGIENVTIPSSVQLSETLPIQLTINNALVSAQWTQLSITIFDRPVYR